jgi:hypothetical protein
MDSSEVSFDLWVHAKIIIVSTDWNLIAAIASAIAALAAVATAIVAYCQTRQASAIAKSTAGQALELAKFTAEFLSIQHLDKQWQSQRMIEMRRSAAKALLQSKTNVDLDQILDFFEEIARLVKRGILPTETAWDTYYWPIANYWAVSSVYAQKTHSDEGATWNNLPDMVAAMKEVEAKESKRPINQIAPSEAQTKEFLEDECKLKF